MIEFDAETQSRIVELLHCQNLKLHCPFCGAPVEKKAASVFAELRGCTHFLIAETTDGVDFVAERAQRHANEKGFRIGDEEGRSLTLFAEDEAADDDDENGVLDQLAITVLSDIPDIVIFEIVSPPPAGDSIWFAFACHPER